MVFHLKECRKHLLVWSAWVTRTGKTVFFYRNKTIGSPGNLLPKVPNLEKPLSHPLGNRCSQPYAVPSPESNPEINGFAQITRTGKTVFFYRM